MIKLNKLCCFGQQKSCVGGSLRTAALAIGYISAVKAAIGVLATLLDLVVFHYLEHFIFGKYEVQ